jgi:DNA-binding NarL/FixJ family response regulator
MSVVLSSHGDFVVEQAGTLAEARAILASTHPALIISDLRLPDGLALGLLGEARERHPDTEILVISVLGYEAMILAAITAGASGYLLKDALPEDIRHTALEVLRGGSPISPSIARCIVMRARGGRRAADAASPIGVNPLLTPRELDILWGIAKGFAYKEIGDRLGISRHTVPTHIKSIYRKLQVDNRSSAVYEAIQHGIIKL